MLACVSDLRVAQRGGGLGLDSPCERVRFGGHEKMSAARVFRDGFSVSGADGPDMTDDHGAADDGRWVVLSD